MEEKKLVPKLRFPGFTEPWEQRKFGDLFEYERPDAYIVKSDNYNNDFNMPVLTANKAFILGYTNEENSYNKPSIIFDDFTLDRKYVDFPYMLKSSAIKILTSKNQHNLRFLFERLNSTRFEVLGHARHYISVVQNTTTLCPSVDEEVCISNLLTKFDELITLHQRKLEHLKLKKKSLLQKLFPKEGEVYPELRFPGFTDPWEQRKFSDIFAEVKSGLSRMLSNDDIGLPVVRASNINDGQLNLVDDIKYWYKNDPQGANTNNYLIEQGDILINFINSEAKMGTAAYVTRRPKRDTIYTTNILRCKVNDEYNPYFIYSLTFLNSYKNYIASITKPAVNQASFTTVDFKKFSIKIPTEKEQNQIADLIKNLNKLITLHQRKLEHLQLLKKDLLQQLFV